MANDRLMQAIKLSKIPIDQLIEDLERTAAEIEITDDRLKRIDLELRELEENNARIDEDAEKFRKLAAEAKESETRLRLRSQIRSRIDRIEVYAKCRPYGINLPSTDKKQIDDYMAQWEERFEVWFKSGEMRRVTLQPVQPNKYLRSKAGEIRAHSVGEVSRSLQLMALSILNLMT